MKGMTIWLLGLPCSGKTTTAKEIVVINPDIVHLDGDILRKGLCSDLGFGAADRDENIRRVVQVAKLFNEYGINCVVAFITPFCRQREYIKRYLPNVLLVHCDVALSTCERRDVKGMWKKARDGIIGDFTGVSQRFDGGELCDITIDTSNKTSAKKNAELLLSVKLPWKGQIKLEKQSEGGCS